MIFVTVGSDLPFVRLVRAVDEWALANNRSDVFAQIGETEWRPSYIAYSKFLEPEEFSLRVASATTVISHAGMGTILTALRAEKPILVMPRLLALREVRNEHQLATSRRLLDMGKIDVAFDEKELTSCLYRLADLKPRSKIAPIAGEDILSTLRGFIART